MQKPCQDSYYTLFSSYPALLEYHEEQAKNSRWIRCKVADLQDKLDRKKKLFSHLYVDFKGGILTQREYLLAREVYQKEIAAYEGELQELQSIKAKTKVTETGGRLSREMRMCLVGEDAQKIFLEINADFAFFSARSLSEDGTLSDCDCDEICVRNAMLRNAKCRVFLCDSSKYSTASGYRQCSLSEVNVLISEGKTAMRFARTGKKLKVM